MDELVLTAAGATELRRQLERARSQLAAAELRLARSSQRPGDTAEMGEYLDAQREQEFLERRVALLEEWLDHSHVLDDPRRHQTVEIGAQAEFEDVDTGERSAFELVGSPESNVGRGRLSVDSPVGRALCGHHPGETVEVLTPKGRRRLKVLAVR